jgi:MFS family permease
MATLGWRATFYVHVPLALLSAGMILLAQKSDAREPTGRPIDLAGTALATAILALGTGTLIESGGLPTAWTVGLLLAVMVFAALFVRVERHHEHPVFDFSLLRHPAVAGAQAAALAYSSAFGALLVFLPRVFEVSSHRPSASMWIASVGMLPLTVPAMIVPMFAARMSHRWSPRTWLASGLLIAAGGAFLAATILRYSERSEVEWSVLPVALFLTGAGFAISNAHMTNIAMIAIPLGRAAVASGMNFTVRQTGVALGVAAAARIYANAEASSVSRAVGPLIAEVCIAASLVSLLGATVAWRLGPRHWPQAERTERSRGR